MSSAITSTVGFLRTSRLFPKEIDQLTVEVNKAYLEIAQNVNARTIGIFPTNTSVVTGESWYISGQVQQTLRQTYTFGAINAGTELDIPHGITGFTKFTRIYGAVTTTSTDYRPLPYIDPATLTTGMALLVDNTNIRIVLGATAVPVSSGVVVLEWLSNV